VFVIRLSAVGDEEEEVVPVKDSNPCTYREVSSGRTFVLMHVLGLPEPLRDYWSCRASSKTSPYFPEFRRKLNAEEVKLHEQAVLRVRELYKKPNKFLPVSPALLAMWNDRQRIQIKCLPWPLHDQRLAGKITFLDDPRPRPTKPSLYTSEQDMTEEEKHKHNKDFITSCASYMLHRYQDWVEARGHQDGKNPFWIDLWNPELLRSCEEKDLDDHPRALLELQWKRHVDEMWKAEEEAKKKQVIYLDDTSDEESVIVMQITKKTRKEIICLDDSSDDENHKENVPNSKRNKKG